MKQFPHRVIPFYYLYDGAGGISLGQTSNSSHTVTEVCSFLREDVGLDHILFLGDSTMKGLYLPFLNTYSKSAKCKGMGRHIRIPHYGLNNAEAQSALHHHHDSSIKNNNLNGRSSSIPYSNLELDVGNLYETRKGTNERFTNRTITVIKISHHFNKLQCGSKFPRTDGKNFSPEELDMLFDISLRRQILRAQSGGSRVLLISGDATTAGSLITYNPLLDPNNLPRRQFQAHRIACELGVEMLAFWAIELPCGGQRFRQFMHDVHYCTPGVPDVEMGLLLRYLNKYPKAPPSSGPVTCQCLIPTDIDFLGCSDQRHLCAYDEHAEAEQLLDFWNDGKLVRMSKDWIDIMAENRTNAQALALCSTLNRDASECDDMRKWGTTD